MLTAGFTGCKRDPKTPSSSTPASGSSTSPAESDAPVTDPSDSDTDPTADTTTNAPTDGSTRTKATTTKPKTPTKPPVNSTTSGTTAAPVTYPPIVRKDKELLYGLCYVQYSMQSDARVVTDSSGKAFDGRVSIEQAASLIQALGAKSVRVWNHGTYCVDRNTDKISKNVHTAMYHELYAALKAKGVKQIIGMSHFHFLPEWHDDVFPATDTWRSTVWVPKRDYTKGSEYMRFLDKYEAMWKALANEFQEIDYWEMGNEMNHNPFLAPLGYTDGSNGIAPFSLEEKANISTDMMFRAHRAIKSVNRDAVTIMPPMAPSDGMYGVDMDYYLEQIYQNIESGKFGSKKTSDFFDALAWHPYTSQMPDEDWVDANKRLYAIAQKHGDHGKKVYMTEVGFPDGGSKVTDAKQAEWLKEMYRLAEKELPFVESISYYRMFNDGREAAGGESYGLFKDPMDGFTAKLKGKAYQQIAGGKGNLDQFKLTPLS